MSRQQPADEDLLFDLPLDRRPAEATIATRPETRDEPEPVEQAALPLLDEPADESLEAAEETTPAPAPPAAEPDEPDRERRQRRWVRKEAPQVTLGLRASAGLTDLGVCAGVLVVLLVALLAQGIRPALADWPAGLLFLLSFSFLYSVLPLAFWGRTPGMTLAGLKATSREGKPMTFRQAVLRWLGSALTVALAGLPLLLALGGRRSLTDLISGSRTRRSGPSA